MIEWIRESYELQSFDGTVIEQVIVLELARQAFAADHELPVGQCSAHRTPSGVAVLGYRIKAAQ